MNTSNIGKYVAGWARRSPATFLLHISLLVIIAGAVVTCLTGDQGQIALREGMYTRHVTGEGDAFELPFSIRLDKTMVSYYPASTAPCGYSCEVEVSQVGQPPYIAGISMDHMLIVDHYRFTLVSIGGDSATLTVNHDPCGIFLTYIGYGLMFLSMLAFFFQPHTGFRTLLRKLAIDRSVALPLLIFTFGASSTGAQEHSPVRDIVPDNVARTFGKIYVYWDDRPAPVQTLSRSILLQVYGKDSYKGQSADQVILGWLVYYDKWKNEPIIMVKDSKVREVIGITGKYARLTDFFDGKGYKLQPLLDGCSGDNGISRVDRSVQLLASVATGSIMRIYPYMSANDRMEWLSWTDYRPSQMPLEQWTVIEKSMSDVVTSIIKGNPDKARSALLKIRNYQLETTASYSAELSQTRFRAEIWYNRIAYTLWVSILLIMVALAAGACVLARRYVAAAKAVSGIMLGCTACWLICLVALRWFIAGHWPLTNGPEAMEVMALMALCVGGACFRSYYIVTPASMVVAGLSLAVAAMSGNSAVISPLLPVLNNPLLSVHVFVIMLAYALLTIIMLLSACVWIAYRFVSRDLSRYLTRLSLVMLYPAVFLLASGIFIGAIWANQSWGRYWGWDPKETWALITMIVYSLPLHWTGVKALRNDRNIAIYLTVSYMTVLITYFGVNFLLGGLHSYS